MGDDESSDLHSEEERGIVESKNKKRTVKTAAQLQALEKFFNEHKYPKESLKIQFAEAVGLTEKQVSCWFCHRRLKDKKLMSGDNNLPGKQERSSGVIQDRGSGHKQDSCGSTKQGDCRNFDNKEVESERLMSKEYSAVDLAHENGNRYTRKYESEDDTTPGSSSPRRDTQNLHPFDNETSMSLVSKLPQEHDRRVKARSGPSGYLKLKGRVENSAITAVKRQLGKHYRNDGPPLGVEFDPIPPGAFEYPIQNLAHESYYSREVVPPALSDVSRIRHNPKFEKGREYEPSTVSYKNRIDGPSFKMRREFCSPMHQNFGHKTTSGNSGAYYQHQTSRIEPFEGSSRNIQQSRRDHSQYGGKVTEKPAEPWFNKFNTCGSTASYRENMKSEYSDAITARETYPLNDGLSRPLDNGFSRTQFKSSKRMHEEVAPRLHQQSYPAAFVASDRYGKVIPQRFSDDDNNDDDDESAETSSSVD